MPTNLIEKLSSLAHLDPDQIVAKLTDGGWVKGSDFTTDRIERWRDQQTRVWYDPGPHSPPVSGDCNLHMFTWDIFALTVSLNNYHFILESNFTGEYPSC